MQEKIVRLGKRLISIGNRLRESPDNYNDWHSMWWGLCGALYSLNKALLLLTQEYRPRNPNKITADARSVLTALITGANPQDENYEAWLVGYYLNDVEFRISLSLHKLLKAFYDCRCTYSGAGEQNSGIQGLFAPALIKKILNPNDNECRKCRASQINLSNKMRKIFQDYNDREQYMQGKNPNYTQKLTIGDLLARAQYQVNDLKHKHMPLIDRESPWIRMKVTLKCLSGVCSMFRYIAGQRGKLA